MAQRPFERVELGIVGRLGGRRLAVSDNDAIRLRTGQKFREIARSRQDHVGAAATPRYPEVKPHRAAGAPRTVGAQSANG